MKVFYAAAVLGPLLLGLTGARAADWGANAFPQNRDDTWDHAADGTAGRHLYQSGSECGPDQATPVWGPHNALLGYACEPASANGS